MRVLVTGGAGYVGARLVPRLIEDGHAVRVLDLYLYGDEVLSACHAPSGALHEVKGDIRDPVTVEACVRDVDAVIHLACISNDPSFDLDPALGKSINLDALPPLVRAAKGAGVRRFVFASSSSVYGVKEEAQVTEELPLDPQTDYARFKAEGEGICLAEADEAFTVTCLRPATVCGWSPRQRLDVVVNLLASQAYFRGRLRVLGGQQYRPNIHIEDMVDAYRALLEASPETIQRGIYNVGHGNQTVLELAEIVRGVVHGGCEIVVEASDDPRSYRINADRMERELGFRARRTIEAATRELVAAFERGALPGAPDDARYWNIKRMQELALT